MTQEEQTETHIINAFIDVHFNALSDKTKYSIEKILLAKGHSLKGINLSNQRKYENSHKELEDAGYDH